MNIPLCWRNIAYCSLVLDMKTVNQKIEITRLAADDHPVGVSFLGMPLASGFGLGIADAYIGFFSLLLMMSCVIVDGMKKEMG